MSRELLKCAFDALVKIEPLIQGWGFTNQNITDAIKAELARPEADPAAWASENVILLKGEKDNQQTSD